MFAFLLMLPIVVVDVSGDRLDPAHTRKLVEHELAVTAVASDDARAAEATGHIEVTGDAKDKKLTVKYRKLDEPVERTIDLSEDTSRAESDAAFLAGNLARDEASELAPASPPPKAEKPNAANAAKAAGESLWTQDDRDLAQLTNFVKQSGSDEQDSRRRRAIVELTAGAALMGAAAVISFTDLQNAEARAAGNSAGGAGGWLLGFGLAGMFMQANPLEGIETRLKEHQANGTGSADALEDVEHYWAEQAKSAKRTRMIGGSIILGIGAVLTGIGTTMLVTTPSGGDPSSWSFSFLGGGLFGVVAGVSLLVTETALERSHRMWMTVRTKPDPLSKFSFGATVLPGGGGAMSLALTF